MAGEKPLKILVSGDVEGRLTQLYNRINNIQKKAGQFDMLFCVGDFFGSSDTDWLQYTSGASKAPIPTFILGPNKAEHVQHFLDPEGGELCENITYLGRKGVYTGSSGLQIVYLSGLDGADIGDKTHFCWEDIAALKTPLLADSRFRGIDILLTSQWPKGVEKYGKDSEVDSTSTGSAGVAQLSLSTRPRYHFSAREGTFYERQPYRNHRVLAEKERHVTRFLGLAKVGNPDKKKYLYAFNIQPLKHMDPTELSKQPQDVTEAPYILDASLTQTQNKYLSNSRVRITMELGSTKDEESSQFFYDMKAPQHQGRKRHHNNRDGGQGPKKHVQASGPCWFCLGSPEVEKHLVVSVGDSTYLALAKGGMVPDHILITPIGHHQSTVVAPDDVLKEIEQYKSALRKCYKSLGKVPVFFERNYRTQHLQIQAVPIPADLSMDAMETFIESAQTESFELAEIPKLSDLKQIVPSGAPYFYAEMPSGNKLLHRIKKNFPLQFGREALASATLLNIPEKVNWKNCSTSKENEADMAGNFKEIFEPFDFTL